MESEGERDGVDTDVVVVGGGIAGLAAAWRLRHRRCVLLEAQGRPGGRIHSVTVDGAPMNLGAHMTPGAGSTIGALVEDAGLATRKLPRSLFALAYGGRRHFHTPQALLPFVMNLSPGERAAFARLGARLRIGARRSVAAARPRKGEAAAETQARVLAFEDRRTLADLAGPLPARVAQIFRALTERNGADPDEMSAGHGLRSFANVWQKTAPGLNIVDGTSALPEALAHGLGDAYRPKHDVKRVVQAGPRRVAVHYEAPTGPGTLIARACILATPAFVTAAIAPGLPARVRSALGGIRYGAFLSLAVSLAGPSRPPWRDTYAVATPDLGFSVLFNHDAMRSVPGDGRSLMLFRGARGAQALIQAGADAFVETWLSDLETHFPEARGRIREATPMAWPAGAPFAYPGRMRLQADLEASPPPILLAGDYLDFPNMEAAAVTGAVAAQRADSWLADDRRPATSPSKQTV